MGKMTRKKFIGYLCSSRGQGHGEDYRPWLQIERKNSSDESNQALDRLPGWQREFHFFSRTESELALIYRWLAVADIREQFPAWPWAHPHPLEGAPGARTDLMPSRGLLEIAKEAGIDHGEYPGTDIPYPTTIDLMVTVPDPGCGPYLIATAVKPLGKLKDGQKAFRTLERLELQRRFCLDLDIPFMIRDSSAYTDRLITNLRWLSPSAVVPRSYASDALIRNFTDEFNSRANGCPIREVLAKLQDMFRLRKSTAQFLFFHGAWTGAIDVDLEYEVMMSQPPRWGGAVARARMRRLLVEVTNER